MMRLHLIEFEDLPACPAFLRDAATDCLRRAQRLVNPYTAAAPLLAEALLKCGTDSILDLCSGSGGPLDVLHPLIEDHSGRKIEILLSDRFPSQRTCHSPFPYHPEPVDATSIDPNLRGFRTMFTAFHHFTPEQAAGILESACQERRGVGIFEVTSRSLRCVFMVFLVTLLPFLITPLMRPVASWQQYFFTYVIPLIPLLLLWDGLVSALRSYSPSQIFSLLPAQDEAYTWSVGTISGPLGLPVTYLIGVPQVASDR